MIAYLVLDKHRPEAIEQLEGRDDVALHENADHHRRRCPVARAHGHLVEPLLQRELIVAAARLPAPTELAKHVVHLHCEGCRKGRAESGLGRGSLEGKGRG